MDPTEDAVDHILAQWRRERPDVDTSPMGVIGRISRLSRTFEKQLRVGFQEHGLEPWEFDVLATLRRVGKPYEIAPTALIPALMVTSGAVTNRIDQLTQRGLVYRKPDPKDRRGNRVGLTAQGLRLIDAALETHVANERSILAPLTPDECATLQPLLRKLLLAMEDRAP